MSSQAHLRLLSLKKAYHGANAVHDISLDIAQHEFVTLLGPSGSGKTTTLMMIAGFTQPDGGRIILDGEDVTYLSPARRNIGVVFQSYSLFPHLSVFENIAYPLKVRGLASAAIRERVESTLALVQLEHFGNRLPDQLSGGQKQRVALARAIVFEPRLLLMDEPLGALDLKLREHMRLEIKRLQQKLNVTVVYVTHDQSEALTMSDRIAVMRDGRIEQVGAPRRVFNEPTNRFVSEFVGEACFLDAVVVESSGDRGCAFVADTFRIHFPLARPVEIGERAVLMVRPEACFVVAAGSLENELDGVIDEIIYEGARTKYRVDLGGNASIHFNQPSHSGVRGYAVGDRVVVGWRTEDTRLL